VSAYRTALVHETRFFFLLSEVEHRGNCTRGVVVYSRGRIEIRRPGFGLVRVR